MAEVTEVEVSPGGEWRVGGTEGRWHSISEDPSLPIEDVKVKADPETAKQEAGRPLFSSAHLWSSTTPVKLAPGVAPCSACVCSASVECKAQW